MIKSHRVLRILTSTSSAQNSIALSFSHLIGKGVEMPIDYGILTVGQYILQGPESFFIFAHPKWFVHEYKRPFYIGISFQDFCKVIQLSLAHPAYTAFWHVVIFRFFIGALNFTINDL